MKGYLCKIVVKYSRPKAWREVIVPENTTFDELHEIMQVIMGLANYHLYLFKLDDSTIVCDVSSGAFDMWDSYEKLDSKTTCIDRYCEIMDKIFYRYDFGDEWEFDVEIKDIVDYDKPYPTLKRHRGKYDLLEDCRAAGGWNYIVQLKENPEEIEFEIDGFDEYVQYLSEYDKEYAQGILKEMFGD